MNQEKQVLEALIAGRALISRPSTWIKGRYATDKNGEFAELDSPEAECFCSVGALRRVTLYDEALGNSIYQAARKLLNDTVNNSNTFFTGSNGVRAQCRGIIMLNDTQTHEKVLGIWDIAIDDLKNQIGE